MAYWLVKSEPDVWSWDQQVAKGAKGELWTGVRNHIAKLNLMKMKKGDRAFFYHSNVGKEIVGIVEIVREHHPDPTAEPGEPWVVVDIKARRADAEAGDARRGEGGAEAQGHGADEALAAVGAAGDGGRVEARLRDGRGEGLI